MPSGRWYRYLGRALALALGIVALPEMQAARNLPKYERPPIEYSRTPAHDQVTELLRQVAESQIIFHGSDAEIVREVLAALHIPIASQLLVFSKTSLQSGLIDPQHPRAIYFSDSAYVGWVPGGLLEVSVIDPQLGPIFYAFDPQDARDHLRTFVRETSCLRCHGANFGKDIPGLFARTTFTTDRGEPLVNEDPQLVNDETPFRERFNGWYVTGYTGTENHRGNTFSLEKNTPQDFRPAVTRPTDLKAYFETAKYLTTTSDVLGLLVFQHQLAMHNALTRAAHQVRRALLVTTSAKVGTTGVNSDEVIATAATEVVDQLLFRSAAPLPKGLDQTGAFARMFVAQARRDPDGRSLKDFADRDSLFSNRCSFLIYSESFHALPDPLRNQIYRQLYHALHDRAVTGRYQYISAEEKIRIEAILRATLPEARTQFDALPINASPALAGEPNSL